jgi:hypothetical protein
MRQINPTRFAYKEAENRLSRQEYAQALNRRKQKEIDSWGAELHTVMELVGGEPTGLIKEMLGTAILNQNANALAIYLQEMGNWNAFGNEPKPMLRELVTPNKFKNLVYREKKQNNKRNDTN